jgi:hypothetical protein
MHHLEIFFSRRQSTTLNTPIESPLFSSKTGRPSSVIGAPSGRHSRLGPAFRAFHSLNEWILLLHDELQNICRNPCSAKMLLHQKLQKNVQWPGGSHWWLRTRRSMMSFTKASWARRQSLTAPIFSTKFPHQVFVSSTCVGGLAFLYLEVQDNIWIYFTTIYHRESLWHHSH